MNYSTIFEVTSSGGSVGVSLGDLAPAIVAIAIIIGVVGRRGSADRRWLSLALLFAGALALMTVSSVSSSLRKDTPAAMLVAAIQAGKGQIAEGLVERFVGGDLLSKRPESFVVDGVAFSYAEGIETGGFNLTAERSGPVHEGLRVRIEYVRSADVFPSSPFLGNVITRLEIAAESP